ncbi:hypothetical protein AHAS_Ahas03G0104600 [Arachis hypogaea]
MAFRILGIRKASLSVSKGTNVPKGYLAVYVGDKMRRFVIPNFKNSNDLLICCVSMRIQSRAYPIKSYFSTILVRWLEEVAAENDRIWILSMTLLS